MSARNRLVFRAGVGLALLAVAALVVVLLWNRGDGKPPADPKAENRPELYRDVTAESGINFSYRNGEEAKRYAILESLGGGVALIDYDGDGLLDIFIPGGGYYDGPDKKQIKGHPCKLFKNLGNWKFTDVTAEVGLDKIDFYTHGATVGDYDRDGHPDLLVTGYGRVALFHNVDNGAGGRKFEDVSEAAGLLKRGHFWGTSAAFADFDGDGYPDLYICQYVNWSWDKDPVCPGYTPDVPRDVCAPKQFDAVYHALYQNVEYADPKTGQKRRGFKDVTKEAGIRAPERVDKDYGKGLGVVVVDVNNDGKPDIYVANDTSGNFLYINRSTKGKLKFEDVGLQVGVARDGGGSPTGSMGADAGDYNDSGLASIWVTNYEGELHSLYRNRLEGDAQFFDYATQTSGISKIGQQFVAFGTAFVDLDLDGHEDLVVINGHVIHHPLHGKRAQRPVLLYNLGDGLHFVDVKERADREAPFHGGAYFTSDHVGRGLAVGDLNNIGRPDLVISHVNEPVTLLRYAYDCKHHWLGIELQGRDHRDYVGARVVVEAGGRKLTRFAKGGGSYLSSSDRRFLIGLGVTEKIDRVTVFWPWGEKQEFAGAGFKCDGYWRLSEEKEKAEAAYQKKN